MTEPRNRTRKVTRKAGPPEAVEFQAPQSTDTDGRSEKSTEKKKSKVPAKTSADNSGNSRNGNGNGGARGRRNGNRSNNRGRRNVVKSMQGADLTHRLPAPPRPPKDGLRIVALGGISEIGRNMTVFEYRGRLLIVDCGVLFPSSGEPGVDLILPDFSYLEDKMDRVEALVVTHGHEDHIGAIPWLLKQRPDLPIIAGLHAP